MVILKWIAFFTFQAFTGAVGGFMGYFYGMWSWQQWFILYLLFYSAYCISFGYFLLKGEFNGDRI